MPANIVTKTSKEILLILNPWFSNIREYDTNANPLPINMTAAIFIFTLQIAFNFHMNPVKEGNPPAFSSAKEKFLELLLMNFTIGIRMIK